MIDGMEEKRFYSKVSPWISVTLWGSIALCFAGCYPIFISSSPFWVSIVALTILLGCNALLISIFFHTYYLVKDGLVYWVTGPFKGKVSIASIREISRAKSVFDISAVIKPTLATKPLLLKYNKYEDIPVSPMEEGQFIEELKKVNAEIEVKLG